MDYIVHGVAKSRIRLSDFHCHEDFTEFQPYTPLASLDYSDSLCFQILIGPLGKCKLLFSLLEVFFFFFASI